MQKFTVVTMNPLSMSSFRGCGTSETLEEARAKARTIKDRTQDWVGVEIWTCVVPSFPLKLVEVIRQTKNPD